MGKNDEKRIDVNRLAFRTIDGGDDEFHREVDEAIDRAKRRGCSMIDELLRGRQAYITVTANALGGHVFNAIGVVEPLFKNLRRWDEECPDADDS